VEADHPRRLKRGVLIGAMAVAVLAIVATVVVVVQVRHVERSTDALCDRLRDAQDLDQSFTTLDPATLDPQLAALARAKAVAPDDIQAQVATLADFVDEVATQVEESTDDRDQALAAALSDRQDQVDSITAAGQAVQAWAQTNCGLSLAGAAPTSSPSTTGP
jgi:biopolymer transport protein ExbB/TolQ